MKAMSKFFLVVAGILTVAGIIVCLIASGLAKASGILLFPEKIDGSYVYTIELNNTDITKISLDVTDADINVITGQDNEYIEFINFNENYYSVSTTNKVLTFDEYVDLASMLAFWDSDFSFKGMRSLIRLGNRVNGEKEINIYISDVRDITVFDFTIANGNISVSDISTETDYKFCMDKGKISMKNISTVSSVSVTANYSEITLEECSLNSFSCDSANVYIGGSIDFCHSFAVNSKNGTIDTDLTLDSDEFEVSILTSGSIKVNDENYSSAFKNDVDKDDLPENCTNVKITGEKLNVSLDYSSLSENTTIEE